MDKQKQIEEMASYLIGKVVTGADSTKVLNLGYITVKEISSILVNAGYRKISENAVVLTREEYEELQKGIKTYNYTAMFDAQSAYRWEQGYLQGTKETAEKFAERVKMAFYYHFDELIPSIMADKIDEICKEITEGT